MEDSIIPEALAQLASESSAAAASAAAPASGLPGDRIESESEDMDDGDAYMQESSSSGKAMPNRLWRRQSKILPAIILNTTRKPENIPPNVLGLTGVVVSSQGGNGATENLAEGMEDLEDGIKQAKGQSGGSGGAADDEDIDPTMRAIDDLAAEEWNLIEDQRTLLHMLRHNPGDRNSHVQKLILIDAEMMKVREKKSELENSSGVTKRLGRPTIYNMTTDRRVVAKIASAYYVYKLNAKTTALSSREWVAAGMPYAEPKKSSRRAAGFRGRSRGRRTFMKQSRKSWGDDDDDDEEDVKSDEEFGAQKQQGAKRKVTSAGEISSLPNKKAKTQEDEETLGGAGDDGITIEPGDSMHLPDELDNEDQMEDDEQEEMPDDGSEQPKLRHKRLSGELAWSMRTEPITYPRRGAKAAQRGRSRAGRFVGRNEPT